MRYVNRVVSQWGVSLSPKEYLTISGDIVGYHEKGAGAAYWHPVDRRCCQTSYNAQNSSWQQKNNPALNVKSAEVEKPPFYDQNLNISIKA